MILSRLSRQVERCGPKNRDRDGKDTDIRSREAPAPSITISCYSTVTLQLLYSLHVFPDMFRLWLLDN